VLGQGAVGEQGGAAQGAQLAGVEAAERGGEERGEQLVGPGRVEGEAEQVEDVADDRLGHELALAGAQPVGDAEPLQGPAGWRAEPPGGGQQDGHPAVGDAVAFVGDPQEAGVGLRLLGRARVAGGLDRGRPTPREGDGRAGAGRLEAAHGVEAGAAEPPAALEQDHAGAEALGPCRQRPGRGATVGVGRAHRVAGQDRPGPAVDQQGEQAELGWVELLGLVGQDRSHLGDGGGQDVGAVLQQVAGLEDEAGLVDRVLEGQVLAVEGQEGRHLGPGGTAGGRGPLEQVVGVDQATLAGEHEVGQLVGERAGVDQRRQRAPVDLVVVEREQRPDQRPLLRAAQRARLAAVVEQVGVGGDEGAGERVPGHAGQLAARGAGQAGQEPLGGGDGGLAAGGEEPGRAARPGQQVVHGRLEQGRLAAAGAAEDDQVARRELGRQLGRRPVGKAHRTRAGQRADDRPRRRARDGRDGDREAAGRLVRGGATWPVHDAGILASGYDAGFTLSTPLAQAAPAGSAPEAGPPVPGEHDQGDGQLGDADQPLKHDIPGRRARAQVPGELQDGDRHAQHPEPEGDQDQPEGPAPAPEDPDRQQPDERRQGGQEADLAGQPAVGGEAERFVIGVWGQDQDADEDGQHRAEEAEDQGLGPVDDAPPPG
jgi:hypothetical protein